MSTPDDKDTRPLDPEEWERSAEERNITTPTPPEVREKADGDQEEGNENGRGRPE
ncbi:hypothetical protein [Streptacidiphilus carbonis]|uniref:hypothetical protein n=1 Tax=Streptacidiphilus carbonis TaxID=105422 RepID=UPI000AE256BF|nr:hypothetical protein [Streptacidiphilus carbonis]